MSTHSYNSGRDYLGFTLCLALTLHAAIILGISFKQLQRPASAPRLEITLAQYQSEQAPEQADFLAQHNQAASGTETDKRQLTTKDQSQYPDPIIQETSPQQPSQVAEQQALRAVISSLDNELSNIQPVTQQTQAKPQRPPSEVDLEQLNQEIASLEAKLDIQDQAYAKRPRIRRLTSVATKQSVDALYLNQWKQKIETIGNRHYPSAARDRNIYGALRLRVDLLPDGSVFQVKILASSGHRVLDDAAIRIVHLAAPYPQFPQAMAAEVDILEIIRTWRFEKNRLVSGS